MEGQRSFEEASVVASGERMPSIRLELDSNSTSIRFVTGSDSTRLLLAR